MLGGTPKVPPDHGSPIALKHSAASNGAYSPCSPFLMHPLEQILKVHEGLQGRGKGRSAAKAEWQHCVSTFKTVELCQLKKKLFICN